MNIQTESPINNKRIFEQLSTSRNKRKRYELPQIKMFGEYDIEDI